MKNITIILIFTCCIISSNKKVNENQHPDIMKPNWDGIIIENLKFKIGDVITIFIKKQIYIGVVMDFNQDEAGVWYGISLSGNKFSVYNDKNINELNFFGRKIPSGFEGYCIDCYDLLYINEEAINSDVKTIHNFKIDIDKISIGSMCPIKNLKEVENQYLTGVKERLKKPTECGKDIFRTERVAERYFKLDNILIN
jgi:hypothetical protein